MSATAIICNHQIKIGNNVTIGGNTVIYDTDFHSLNPLIRKNKTIDKKSAFKLPVTIEDNVFIGAHTTILKGVTIGQNSIIGACSVVTKTIPANEIWAGNPARFIRKLEII
jgi:acetyltransferase-like isoleucine patch superfamily enzyme